MGQEFSCIKNFPTTGGDHGIVAVGRDLCGKALQVRFAAVSFKLNGVWRQTIGDEVVQKVLAQAVGGSTPTQ